ARLEELENAVAESLDPGACGEESREEWNRLAERTRAASEAVRVERGRLHALSEAAESIRAEWRVLRRARDAYEAAAPAAMRLSEVARDFPGRKSGRPVLPGWRLVLALVFPAMGTGSILFLAGTWAAGMAALATLGAAAAVILGRRQMRIEERDRLSRTLTLWKAQWGRESQPITGDAVRKEMEQVDSAVGFLRGLEAWETERKNVEAREAEVRGRLEAMEAALEESGADMAALREGEERRRSVEKAWLGGHGAASEEEFLVRLSRRRRLLSELPGRRREMEALAPGGDLAAFRRDLLRRLQGLDEEGVPMQGSDDAGLQRLRRRRQDLLARIEDLGSREREMAADREGMAGEIRGALGKMAAGIVAVEERLAAAEVRIKVLELDKKAAAMAMEIFRDMGA